MSVRKVYLGWLPKGVANAKALKTSYDIAIGSLPTKIVITRPPNKLDYVDGEAIDLTGIIVNAYCEDESAFSVVPTKELIIDPTAADATKKQGGGYTYDVDTSPVNQPIPANKTIEFKLAITSWGTVLGYRHITITADSNTSLLLLCNNNVTWTQVVGVSKSTPNATIISYDDRTGETTEVGYSTHIGGGGTGVNALTYNGKTAYWRHMYSGIHYIGQSNTDSVVDGSALSGSSNIDYIDGTMVLWVAVWGEASGGGQPITVKWKRPIDNQVLETSFAINVNEQGSTIEHTYHGEQDN